MAEKPKDRCRVCRQPFYRYPMGEKNGFRFIGCKACGSVMVDPPMIQAFLDDFFGQLQPQITHLPDPDDQVEQMTARLRKVIKNPEGKRFLDVGSRQGYAVIAAKNAGMKALGIDRHEFYAKFAQEVYDPALFQHTSVQEYAASDPPKYDVIFSIECLAEQTDLEGFMRGIAHLLAPGGAAYFEEADGNNFNLPKNFTDWEYVHPPLNFIYLSKKGFIALLHRHGLMIQKMFFTWKPIMRIIAAKHT
jgi:SAM-dependent methyltransferase